MCSWMIFFVSSTESLSSKMFWNIFWSCIVRLSRFRLSLSSSCNSSQSALISSRLKSSVQPVPDPFLPKAGSDWNLRRRKRIKNDQKRDFAPPPNSLFRNCFQKATQNPAAESHPKSLSPTQRLMQLWRMAFGEQFQDWKIRGTKIQNPSRESNEKRQKFC